MNPSSSLTILFSIFSYFFANEVTIAAHTHFENFLPKIRQMAEQCPPKLPQRTGFRLIQPSATPSIINLLGDVNDVLAGQVNEGVSTTHWPSKSIIGFGAGGIDTIQNIGEAVFANGYTYVRSTDNSSANYFQTISHTSYLSTFAIYVHEDAIGDGFISFKPSPADTNLTMMDLYNNIHNSVDGLPYCFYGLIKFTMMDAIAISKPPIFNEPLFGDTTNDYYTQPNFNLPNVSALIFGCAANFSRIQDPVLNRKMNKALYVNPMDESARNDLQVHSHVLELCPSVTTLDQIVPETVLGVYHLLSSSTVGEFSGKVFKMDSADKIIEIETRIPPVTNG